MIREPKVLIVDDYKDNLWLVRCNIGDELGIEYHEVESINRAIELIDRINFDLVVCDYHLSPGTGDQVLRYLRQCKLNEVPFILFTTDKGLTSSIQGYPNAVFVEKENWKLLKVLSRGFLFDKLVTRFREVS